MTRLVSVPPATQLAPLIGAYSKVVAAKRRQVALGLAVAAVALLVSAVGAEVQPVTLWNKIGNFTSYFDRLLKLDTGMRVWTDPQEWFWGLARWSRLLGETLLIAYVATLTGAVAAFVGAAPASRNLMRLGWVRFVVRRILEFCRSVPDLVFAMIFVAAFGLGALPGVLALAIHTAGALGKLFTEIVENIDMRPVDGVASTGGSWVAQVRFAVYSAGAVKPRQLHAAAVRDQCARCDGDRLCRGRRHRSGSDRCHPQILLFRCQRHAADDYRDRDGDRRALSPPAPPAAGAGEPAVSETRELRQTLLSQGEALHARYPDMLTGGWRQRIPLLTLSASAIVVYLVGLVALGISPIKIISGAGRLIDIAGLMLPPDPDTWSRFLLYLGALGQTLAIAFLGTLVGAIIGCPFGFLAARNVVVNRLLRLLTRRSLDTVRSVDTLIWALIWINVVGLGPFAGALAIMSTDLGAFGKLMSEAIEAADRKPVDGVLSVGGSRLHGVRFGMLPQVLPVFASQLLYFFESNTRSATIIGIVGAGGIGLQLSEQIRVLEWQQVSFLILMVLVTVAALDWISQRLRSAIIGHRP